MAATERFLEVQICVTVVSLCSSFLELFIEIRSIQEGVKHK